MKLAQSKVHFIGIGGIGMCGLAELLHNMGAKVVGSDLSENGNSQRLRQLGIPVFIGHSAKQVGDADVVVYSSAVPTANVEYQEAKRKQIPLIPRAEILAEIMRLKRAVAVAGTHGKTTTTAMIAAIFLQAKAYPTIVIGGRLDLIKSTALLGKGEWLIAEADESDGSFSRFSPEIAIVTNVDNDHLDHYGNIENLQRAFFDFACRIPFYGLLIACGDDASARRVFSPFSKRVVYYGFSAENDLILRAGQDGYEVIKEGHSLGSFRVRVPGRHNALNAVAAIAAGLEAGFDFQTCVAGLQNFAGVDRRFHFKGSAAGIEVYDDYGHHPAEVRAVLEAFREKYPTRRLIVLFQPHRFTRTQLCWQDFLHCFALADQLYLYDIYPAGEKPIEDISSRLLADDINREIHRELNQGTGAGINLESHSERSGSHGVNLSKVSYLQERDQAVQSVLANLRAGDVVVTLGAGDIWKDGMGILENLQTPSDKNVAAENKGNLMESMLSTKVVS